jgi:hypothetical protein
MVGVEFKYFMKIVQEGHVVGKVIRQADGLCFQAGEVNGRHGIKG